ncbi:MAG: hypothetical protein MZV70_28365 [Desulfobacterales bacterium]|nr:hypothetical protein [Desulfobacterales bacterium]
MLNLISEITIKKNYLLQRTKEAGNISNEILFAGKRLFGEVNDFADRHECSAVTRTDRYVDPLFSEFGELEFDRYDEQNLFSRKLQEMTEDLSEAVKELSQLLESFQEDMKNMDGMIRLLRSDITDSRMMEIGRFFQRFVRPVRSMGKEYGKNVELMVSNGETKIDRVIFERIFDPFLHIIRNAICHGIETPEQRVQNGKKAEGQIVLSARREGSSIMIEISDDGRGIDTDKLLLEGVKRRIFKPGTHPSHEEILSLIFLPGSDDVRENRHECRSWRRHECRQKASCGFERNHRGGNTNQSWNDLPAQDSDHPRHNECPRISLRTGRVRDPCKSHRGSNAV